MHAPVVTTGRDLRLDLFRGIALWLIFLDHIPSNLVAWGTIRNYGFSDATEIFVFVSGYTAAFVYGKEMRERGLFNSSAHILRLAYSAARVADLGRPRVPVRNLSRRNFLCRDQFRDPALCRRDEHSRFSQAARGDHRRGAAAQFQARQYGRIAALHHSAALV